MKQIHFTDKSGTFTLENPENYSALYFPIASEQGLKGSVSPDLGGDSKLDQESFLLEPVSVENLHNNRSTRNFWCYIENEGCWSVTGASAEAESLKFTKEQDKSSVEAGFMYHTTRRASEKYHLESEVTIFVPVMDNVEVMYVKVRNTSDQTRKIIPTAAIPLYGRSADNIRDHRNVTSMLHRIHTGKYGVYVKPTMSFDEKGHRRNHKIYYTEGIEKEGNAPVSFYPTADVFIGEGGTYTHPRAVYENLPGVPAMTDAAGKEAMGAFRFDSVTLSPMETAEYIIFTGVTENEAEPEAILEKFGTAEKVQKALAQTKQYWQEKVNVSYHTGDERFDLFLRWVSFQPLLRRIYGCSFLPYHDYGRGGRGWRDLWQDCLSLLLMDPGNVRQMILDNFGGVRTDGTNATIIGHGQGEFVADRNGISRVWMDHAVWPFKTTKLYIDQTGDLAVLTEKLPYFKDPQCCRGRDTDKEWSEAYGMQQKTSDGTIYKGSVLEHLLIEHLCAFYEVGEHNEMLIRGADWNDALDMASVNGESVAFTCAYAGNMKELAQCLQLLKEKHSCTEVTLLEEAGILLTDKPELYEDVQAKNELLQKYAQSCKHNVSGKTIQVSVDTLIHNLNQKADWIMNHVRNHEWIKGEGQEGWFNSYYDDSKNAVEGFFDQGVRMMLTGQVFAVMSGTATDEQIHAICKSADRYLYDASIGGYRLNTDFHELKFDMGRMFGFAYGEKENGAVFSHMTVMYANALYKRGFVKEGYKALQTLADTALNFDVSRIYPGIPEYFNSQGRGMYHYLTGAASWYMMTMITEVFGVRGEAGTLTFCPKLMKCQFDEKHTASISLTFAGKKFEVIYINENDLEYGEYRVGDVACDTLFVKHTDKEGFIDQKEIEKSPELCHQIKISLVP